MEVGHFEDLLTNETFIDAFLRQVKKSPDAPAVVDEYGSVTYGELDRRSDFIAAELLKTGVQSGDFVAVKMPRVKEFLVAVLGIWKAGGAYMPVDPTYPEERIRYMLEDSGANVTIDESWMERLRSAALVPVNNARPDGIAIIIYTSGSTGRPKGVLNTHRAVRLICDGCCLVFGFRQGDKVASEASFCFIMSVYDIFPTLASGLTVHILSNSVLGDTSALDVYIRQNRIDFLTVVPQIGLLLLNRFHTPLKAVCMAGSKVKAPQKCSARVLVAYGLTETCSLVSFIELNDRSVSDKPLLGRPLSGVTVVLEDEDGNPVPRGEIGEVCIASPQVAVGYWHNDELTAMVFVERPWSEYRVLRTGDLGRWNGDGVLEFHGRRDDMVKIRGNRVELGEVESVLLKVKGVRAGTVAMKEVGGESMLCAYYLSPEPVSPEFLHSTMSKLLPPYMIPSFFVRMDALPRLPNGKLDRLSLPVPDVSMSEKSENIVAPESEFERKVFPAVAREVGTENFGVTTNLISLGLTSLRAIKLSAALKSELGLDIPQAELLAHPVIRDWETLSSGKAEAIPVEPVREYYPLTDNQMGLYVEWERNREADMYNLPFVLKIMGGDAQKLLASVQETVKQYPLLKMHIGERNGAPVQIRRDDAILPVGFEKLDFEPDDVFFGKLVRPFNLLGDDLARFNVFSSPSAVWLFFDVHHIIFDGGSVNLFMNTLSSVYRDITPSGESVTVYDYSLYREKWQGSGEFAGCGRYFEKLLEGTESFNYPSMKNGTSGGPAETVTVTIPREGIRSFCSGCSVTENSFFATVLTQVFHRVSREDTIQMAMFSSGRSMTELSGSIGMFVQTLPLVSHAADGTVGEMLRSIHAQIVETLSRDRYPYTHLSERFGMKPNVMYVYQGDLIDDADFGGVESEWHRLPVSSAISPLTVEILPEAEEYRIKFEYDGGLYGARDIELLSGAVRTLAEGMAKSPDTAPLGSLSMVSEEEKASLLSLGTGERLDYDRAKTFVDLFIEQTKKTPDNIAVVDNDSRLTYRELDEHSNALAHWLIEEYGITQGDFIAVMLPRRKEFVTAVLGIWKAGAAYVPIDPCYPEERVKYMVDNSGAKAVIDETYCHNIAVCGNEHFNATRPENAAYMIYTSGSTGKPKGVVIPHKALICFCHSISKEWGLTSDSRISCYSSFSFDASVEDLYPVLTVGGTLYLPSEDVRKDLTLLADFVRNNVMTGGNYTTQIGQMLAASYPDLPLDYLVFGGEKMNMIPHCSYRLINTYGPTEVTVDSTFIELDGRKEYGNIPIGRPLDNLYAFICDSSCGLLPRGMAGELCMAGPQLSSGYWHCPEQTAEVFVDCPYLAGQKMYRTGDLVRWNEDGNLEYIGRIDNQVKLRGFRIEMGEIESALSKLDGIISAVAQVKTGNGIQNLCAYYVADAAIEENVLKSELSKSLTEYMIPDTFIRLDKMPLTPGGKVDRKALPLLDKTAAEIVAPETVLEQRYFAIACELLKTDRFGVTTNLISVGLTSITAMKFSSKLRQIFGVVLNIRQILTSPTLRGIIGAAAMAGAAVPEVKAFPKQRFYPPSDGVLDFYFDWERHPKAIQSNISSVMTMDGICAERLRKALIATVQAHPFLKMRIVDINGKVMMERRDEAEVAVCVIKVRKEPGREFFNTLVKPFDLKNDDLYRLAIYEYDGKVFLFSDFHHCVIDGTSINIFWDDLARAYDGEELKPETFTAYDQALEEQLVAGEALKDEDVYFETLMGSKNIAVYPCSIITDCGADDDTFRCVSADVDGGAILAYCREHGLTESNFFLTVTMLAIRHLTHQNDIVLTVYTNGRSATYLQQSVGPFLKALPVSMGREDVKPTFAETVNSIQAQTQHTYSLDHYPFKRLMEKYGLRWDITYIYQGGIYDVKFTLDGKKFDVCPLMPRRAQDKLHIEPYPNGKGGYRVLIEYDGSLFGKEDMLRLANCIKTMAERTVKQVGFTV